MRLNLLYPDRLKRTQTNMQGHKAQLNATLYQLIEQLRCKMQPGSRSGDRPGLLGIHRLVALLVDCVLARRAPDIRRKRNFSVLFDKSLKILFRKKADTPLPCPRGFHPFAPKIIRKINAAADFLVLAALTQDLPDFSLGSGPSNQEEFDFSAGRLLPA